jgi:hypothetical protein
VANAPHNLGAGEELTGNGGAGEDADSTRNASSSERLEIEQQLAAARARVGVFDMERAKKLTEIDVLAEQLTTLQSVSSESGFGDTRRVALTNSQKLAVFRDLFRGREDIYPTRWENSRTGKSGYTPNPLVSGMSTTGVT